MKRKTIIILFAGILAVSCRPDPAHFSATAPDIFPDYVGVTVPAGIAPLDFCIEDENVTGIYARAASGSGLSVSSFRGRSTRFPARRWHRMLASAKGDTIKLSVTAKTDSGWVSFKPFNIIVSKDDIDYGLCYRKISPGYEAFGPMGIYERDLSSFRERALIENDRFFGCVNCHSFNRCNPDGYSLHIRGKHGATLLQNDGKLEAFNTKTDKTIGSCVYPYWHPSGKYIAYSSNDTHQGFHVCPDKLIEVFDCDSDVQIYDLDTGELTIPSACAQKGRWESFPAFSPDGEVLYFTSAAPEAIPDSLTNIRYNLCKVGFNADTGQCGGPEDVVTVIDAASGGKSVAFPKPSFDGRFLMYTLSDYGTFPIWHHEADLWLMDLESGKTRPVDEANSEDTDSYHDWDSSSRWFVFSSRRLDGLFTRLFICHIDENGNVGKPFLLPQRNPGKYYSELFRSYNVPEFVASPVPFNTREALKLIKGKERRDFKNRKEN